MAPPAPQGIVVAAKGVQFSPHFLCVTYTLLRGGYVAQTVVSGPTAPSDLPVLLERLATTL